MTIDWSFLDRRPIVVAIAGPNGAGKTTFYHAHLAETELRFINADVFASELGIAAYEAAEIASAVRNALVARQESFVFETVLSDPVGAEVDWLASLVGRGYEVVLIFIQISDAEESMTRVSMRVSQGGHDVPDNKRLSRFERIQANLRRAVATSPHVLIFDNSDLARPYRHVATYGSGKQIRGDAE